MQNISNFFSVSSPSKSILFYLALLVNVLLLSACGGGGSDAGGDNNNVNTDVTGNSTINAGTTTASIGTGVTEYTVSGLSPNTLYNVWVHDVTADVALSTYIEPGYLISTCSSDNAGVVTEECTTASSVDGKIYLKISSAESTSFSITVRTLPQNEGSAVLPVNLTLGAEHAGQVGSGSSYYKLSGLTPGLVYNVSMLKVLLDADLTVSMKKDFSQHCLSENTGQQNESCQIPANFEGDIYITTSSGGFGSYYSLMITATAVTENIFEGYSDAPKDLTGLLPYSGQVNRDNSFYMFTGLTPGVRYEVRITNNTVNTQVHFYDTLEYAGVDCSINYGFDVIPERLCVATAPASGNLYLAIPYYGTPGGTYTINIGLAPVAEGNSTTPKVIPSASMPYNGQVDTTYSYYVITGLTPNYIYEVQFNDKTHQYAKMAIGDSLSTFNLGCNPCTIRSNASGEVYLKVDGTSTDNENNDLGAWFTLAFGDAENAEGSVASPVVIPEDGTKYDGQVGDLTSYYSASGLAPGKYYQIYLTTDDYDKPGLFSYTDNTYTTLNCKFLPGMCLAPADASGNLHLAVYGIDIYGVRYKVWIQPSEFYSEGASASPLDITGALVTGGTPSIHNGEVSSYTTDAKVEGVSYYQLIGLPGSTHYSIATSNLTDDIRLEVYSDAAFNNILCASSRLGLYNETCDVISPPVGGAIKNVNLYVKVTLDKFKNSSIWDGAKYTLTASLGGTPLLSEGSAGSPVDITSSLPYTTAVRKNENSYYVISGLDPASAYATKLTYEKVRLDLSIWTDNTFTTNACNAGISDEFSQHLSCMPTVSGELFIKVEGEIYTDSDFSINLVAIPGVEGSAGVPVDISASLPYSGQANNKDTLKSYYVVSGLLPSTQYIILTKNSTRRAYTAVYANADFVTDYQCFNNGYPPSEGCSATSNASGELFISVTGNDLSGSYFDLDVKPVPITEGEPSAPVTVPYQAVFQGQGANAGSYYKVTGLTPYSGHRVSLLDQDDDHWMQIFTDNTYQYPLCSNSNENYAAGCGATADANGNIYFKISNNTGYYQIFIP